MSALLKVAKLEPVLLGAALLAGNELLLYVAGVSADGAKVETGFALAVVAWGQRLLSTPKQAADAQAEQAANQREAEVHAYLQGAADDTADPPPQPQV